ncbi:MAG: hypothetical protein IJU81_08820 [Bacteroidales bacterium]|nr:hypothetical protein [Bacteroidales bacterium]
MKKRSNVQFDEMMLTVDNTAILAMQVIVPHFEVAHILNEIFKYGLWRCHDLMAQPAVGSVPVSCPLFHQFDDLRKLRYILLDIGAAPHLVADLHVTCNLLLIISGDDAWDMMDNIMETINGDGGGQGGNPAEQYKIALLNTLKQNILTCETIDLRDCENDIEQDDSNDDLWVVQSCEPKVATVTERPTIVQTNLFGDMPTVEEPLPKPAPKRRNAPKISLAQKKVNGLKYLFKHLEDYFAEAERREKNSDNISAPLIPLI